jgi:hypothetical protein
MNTSRPAAHLTTLLLSLGLLACSDPAATPTDAGAPQDASARDAASDAAASGDVGVTQDVGPADASSPRDTGADASLADASSPDASSADASSADASSADASADVGAQDASMMDASDAEADAQGPDPRCMFLDLNVRYVRCDLGDYQLLRYFEDPNLGDATCPPYYVLRGTRYASPEDALAGESCDGTCQYAPQNSFTVLRCGVRTGYELWTARDCDDIYITPDGVYPSVEAWEMANPC